jgi:hypothetical protein
VPRRPARRASIAGRRALSNARSRRDIGGGRRSPKRLFRYGDLHERSSRASSARFGAAGAARPPTCRQGVSREIVLGKLIDKALVLALEHEHGGAERGLFILSRDGVQADPRAYVIARFRFPANTASSWFARHEEDDAATRRRVAAMLPGGLARPFGSRR